MPATRVLTRTLYGPLALVPHAPRKHGAGEDVVKDLEAPSVVAPDDAMVGQRGEYGFHINLGNPCVFGKVTRLLGDLGSRGGDEMIEELGGDVLLRRLQRREGTIEMVRNDPAAASESLERRDTELVGARTAFGLPEPLHHELEERSFDSRRPVGGGLRLGAARRDAADGDLVEDALDESRLDRDPRPPERRQALERPGDRPLARTPVEAVEAQVVAEDVRNQRFEPVELREGVLTHREKHVDAQRLGHELGQLPLERARLRVVEEVLLGLVEDEVDVAIGGGPPHRLGEPRAGREPAAVATSSASASEGSSPHRANTTTSGSSGSSRRERATPARSSEDLPTPLGP